MTNKIMATLPLLIIAAFTPACAPGSIADKDAPRTAIPSLPSPTPPPAGSPTLPPTFTPLPEPTAAPAAGPIFQPVPMTAEDQQTYNAALEDIELYRKGDLALQLTDGQDQPLAGYDISYRQIDHDFWFGTVADPTTADLAKAAGMNGVTVLPQWWLVEPEEGKFELTFTNFWAGIDELASMGFRVKTNDMFNPAGDPDYMVEEDFDAYLDQLQAHVATLVQRFGPAIDQWEAILEPNYGNHNPYDWTHDQYLEAISTSIQAIRHNDPTAQVEVNLSYPCGGIEWLDNFAIVEEMLRRDLDFDVLGLQLYYNSYILNPSPYPMTRMSLTAIKACVDRYQAMLEPHGKSIAGSEICLPAEAPEGAAGYWGYPWSEDLQAQYLTTAYTILFSIPDNHSLTWWDFQSNPPGGFVYQGGLIDENQHPRKAYFALKELIDSWTTSGQGTTGDDGSFRFRGFAGNYEILITDPSTGSQMRTEIHLSEQSSQDFTLAFQPADGIEPLMADLSGLVEYWQDAEDPVLVQTGNDHLALAAYHQELGEIEQARRALESGLEALAITQRYHIPVTQLKAAVWQGSGPVIENETALIWSGSTLYHTHNFPAGQAAVEVYARGNSAGGTYPTMVIGIGGHASQPFIVDHRGLYTAEYDLSGDEDVFTIRFVYEDNQNPGEFKLFVEQVDIWVRSSTVPPGE